MTSVKSPPGTGIYLDAELVENLRSRLNRIEGHVRGVSRMLEQEEDCDDILIQLSAIKAAVNQVTIKVLEGHMHTCLEDCVMRGDVEPLEDLQRALALVLKNA